MNNLGDKSNFFKNPIGVIGIFLVLTEAIASMVIVKSSLKDIQNTILVLFIVLFPCLVLFVFYLLVTKHHEKLYSPSDYKDEKNFVNTYNNVTQKEEMKKIDDNSGELNEENDKSITIIKDALSEIVELQKKIIPTLEKSVLSDDDKANFVSSMDDLLLEMEPENTLFKVKISPMYKASEFVGEMIKLGYDASVYRFGMGDKKVDSTMEHEAIWLGSEVPVDMTVNVLRAAKRYYPHLKYIYLDEARKAPEYVKYQIFIGGASKTARERKLRCLSNNDFNRLYEMHTKEELHNFVRGFDPYYDLRIEEE